MTLIDSRSEFVPDQLHDEFHVELLRLHAWQNRSVHDQRFEAEEI